MCTKLPVGIHSCRKAHGILSALQLWFVAGINEDFPDNPFDIWSEFFAYCFVEGELDLSRRCVRVNRGLGVFGLCEMPVMKPLVDRSSLGGESPPRKKFKFSLKLLPKKRTKLKFSIESDSDSEHTKDNYASSPGVDSEETSNYGFRASDSFSSTFGRESSVTPPLPYSGLANLGNTCYLNAVLQVLRYSPHFLPSLAKLEEIFTAHNILRESGNFFENSGHPSIIHGLNKLSTQMESAEGNYNRLGVQAREVQKFGRSTTLTVWPEDFVKDFSGLCPMFAGYQQHDAQEFLRSLLALVEEECNGLVKGKQQESGKTTTNLTNSSESKVRGGCKYPGTVIIRGEVSTNDEATSALLNKKARSSPKSSEASNEMPSNGCTCLPKSLPMSKSLQKDFSSVNIVKELFEGTLLLQTLCLNCEGVRRRFENFQDISVPIQSVKNETDDVFGNDLSDSEDEQGEDCNLAWAISKFASVERLSGDNKYFCDNCARLTEADISMYFEKLPQVLTIHLKRFQTSYSQNLFSNSWVTKVTKSLATPQQLSLTKWCSETCPEKSAIYTLFGVVMHSGMSSCSGHYLSYVNIDILNKQNCGEKLVTADHQVTGPEEMESEEGKGWTNVDDESLKDGERCNHGFGKCAGKRSPLPRIHGISCSSHSLSQNTEISKSVKEQHDDDDDDVKFDETLGNFLPSGRAVKDHSERFVSRGHAKAGGNDSGRNGIVENFANSVNDVLSCKSNWTVEDNEGSEHVPRVSSRVKRSRRSRYRNLSPVRRRNDHVDFSSDSSSDEADVFDASQIPRSMNITRYFKPIRNSDQKLPRRSKSLSEKGSEEVSSRVSKEEIPDRGGESKQGLRVQATEKKCKGSDCEENAICHDSSEVRSEALVDVEIEDDQNKSDGEENICRSSINLGKNVLNANCGSASSQQNCCVADDCYSSQVRTSKVVKSSHTNGNTLENCVFMREEECVRTKDLHSHTCSTVSSSNWLKFDDAEVHEITAEAMNEILSPSSSCYSTPYLLFYFRT